MSTRKTVLISIMLTIGFIGNAIASSWLKDKLQPKEVNPEVSVVIMRWGTISDGGGVGKNAIDRIVGQVASDNVTHITLIFESAPQAGKITRLTVKTPVQRYTDGKSQGSTCKNCNYVWRSDNQVMARGAPTTGGHMFDFTLPHDPNFRKVRLVDVQSTDGESLHYFVKFNVSPDLVRSPLAVPISKLATVHSLPESDIKIDVVDAPVDTAVVQKAGSDIHGTSVDRTKNQNTTLPASR